MGAIVDSSAQSATAPLLETKLYIPRRHPWLVSRPSLLRRLDQGTQRALTLVSAPAGSGKSTLLALWAGEMAAGRRAAAWLSLDPSDNNPALFWTYVVTALRTARPDLGESTLSWLSSARPPPIESVLTGLINEINSNDQPFALVLDDYHVIDTEPIHSALAFLLDHLPPQMRLVIATRSDPPLPLARLRGRGQLTELRAKDLRFTPEEAAAFLNEMIGLGLSAADVALLEARTEGWIVGLQLAALSMQGRKDLPGFIRAFAGNDRYIVDYLVDEVLRRQPDRVRSFLLQTSVLDSLNGSLCGALTGQEDGQEVLETLERGNLFVVPLDDKRHWFRYHHLFADVLRARLLAERPRQVSHLHQRAGEWYERHGLPANAVRHALAAEDFGRAAGLLEREGRAMLTTRRREFLDWLKAMPEELIGARPVLAVYSALALLPDDLAAAEARLRDAEEMIGAAGEQSKAAAVEMVVVDDDALRALPGTVAIARAYLAGSDGDVSGTLRYALRALELLPHGDHMWRGAAGVLLGLAHWSSGSLEDAYEALAGGVRTLRMTGDVTHEITGAFLLANIRKAQGRLRAAEEIYQRALGLAADQGGPVPPATADLYVGLSELSLERNDLDAASLYLRSSTEIGEHGGLPENRHRWYVAMARIEAAKGDLDGALDLLGEAERLYIGSPGPNVGPVAAVRARLWVRQGRLVEATNWARERGLSVDADVSYLREFEHTTLARLLIARHRTARIEGALAGARSLLARLQSAAEDSGRVESLIEVLVLQALAEEAQGGVIHAKALLERALVLAEREGYVRLFLDEGEAMRALLRHATADGPARAYARHLLSAFNKPARPGPAPRGPATAELAEALTRREVEILRLIAAGLRNQEIAERLCISVSTVKRHIANAYGKLGVGHRTEAVVRATALRLL